MVIPQTVAFDERPEAVPFPWAEYVVVGPRTSVAGATAIREPGSKLIIKVQPVRWFLENGQPHMGSTWDRLLSTLPYLDSPTLDEPGEGMEHSKLLDFRTLLTQNLAMPLTQLCANLGAMGVLFDYGCASIAGAPDGWTTGYWNYRQRVVASGLRVWHACNRPQSMGGSLMFENIRSSGLDDGYPPNYRQVRDRPGYQNMLLIQSPDVRHRRIICGIALETGALVNYRPAFFTDRWANSPAPEMIL